jgi:hypothetical protein
MNVVRQPEAPEHFHRPKVEIPCSRIPRNGFTPLDNQWMNALLKEQEREREPPAPSASDQHLNLFRKHACSFP